MGELAATKGRAELCGHDIARDRSTAYSNLGCCFQFDALFDLLTGV
jgi:ABC-type multidrug transport system ATPase subunit